MHHCPGMIGEMAGLVPLLTAKGDSSQRSLRPKPHASLVKQMWRHMNLNPRSSTDINCDCQSAMYQVRSQVAGMVL